MQYRNFRGSNTTIQNRYIDTSQNPFNYYWSFFISYINIAADTDAFKEVTLPRIGISTRKSHLLVTSLEIPLPSLPITKTVGISYFRLRKSCEVGLASAPT